MTTCCSIQSVKSVLYFLLHLNTWTTFKWKDCLADPSPFVLGCTHSKIFTSPMQQAACKLLIFPALIAYYPHGKYNCLIETNIKKVFNVLLVL